MTENTSNRTEKLTTQGVFASSLLSEPLASLFLLLPLILYRDLGATPFQVALFAACRPVMAICSLYWISGRRYLRSQLLWSGVLARAPFLCFPWITQPWQLIACTAIYWVFLRGAIPSWMEILKRNLSWEKRTSVFSSSAAWAYSEGIVIGIALGSILDQGSSAWRWLFPLCACIGMVGVYFQSRIPLARKEEKKERPSSLKERLYYPWLDAWQLLKERPDFLRFQWQFMCCGFALMLLHPASTLFIADTLKISYTSLAVGVSICKGIGFAASSSWWKARIQSLQFQRFSGWVCLGFAVFPLILWMSEWNFLFFYLAYLVYGVAQAGSHLSWHLSGTLFSNNEESSRYSSVNIVTVGIRGTVGPLLGAALYGIIPVAAIFLISALLSVYSTWDAWAMRKIPQG